MLNINIYKHYNFWYCNIIMMV